MIGDESRFNENQALVQRNMSLNFTSAFLKIWNLCYLVHVLPMSPLGQLEAFCEGCRQVPIDYWQISAKLTFLSYSVNFIRRMNGGKFLYVDIAQVVIVAIVRNALEFYGKKVARKLMLEERA